jgi:MraZ protein
VYRGLYTQRLDDRGRLALPAKFREVLAERGERRLVLTLWRGCVWVYALADWLDIEVELKNLPGQRREVRDYRSVIVGNSHEVELDGQGRILIPAMHREMAGLEHEVVVTGAVTRMELRDKERWMTMQPKSDDEYDTLDEAVAEYNLPL